MQNAFSHVSEEEAKVLVNKMNTIDNMSVNAIRILSADAIQKANSGHPGLPLGAAPMAYELWMRHLKLLDIKQKEYI